MFPQLLIGLLLIPTASIAMDNYGMSPQLKVDCSDLVLNGLIAVDHEYLKLAPEDLAIFEPLPKKPKASEKFKRNKALQNDFRSWTDILPSSENDLDYYTDGTMADYSQTWEVALDELKNGNIFKQSRQLLEELQNFDTSTDSDEYRLATTLHKSKLLEARKEEAVQIAWLMKSFYKVGVPAEARFAFAQILAEETQVAFNERGHLELAERVFAWEIQRSIIFPEYAIAMMVKYYGAAKPKGGGSVVFDFALPLLRGQLKIFDNILLLNHRESLLMKDFIDKILIQEFFVELKKGNVPLKQMEFFVKNNYYNRRNNQHSKEFSAILNDNPELLDHDNVEKMVHQHPRFASWYMRFVSVLD